MSVSLIGLKVATVAAVASSAAALAVVQAPLEISTNTKDIIIAVIGAGQVIILAYIARTANRTHAVVNSTATALKTANEAILLEAKERIRQLETDNKVMTERLMPPPAAAPVPAAPLPVTVVDQLHPVPVKMEPTKEA